MFGASKQLFTLFGFPVRVDASWLLIVVLLTWSLAAGVFPVAYPELSPGIYWVMGIFATLGLFASIVIHELGHALMARRYGTPMKGITLFIFGGVAEMQNEPPSPVAEFNIAIAGPIASVVVGGVALALSWATVAVGWRSPVTAVVGYIGMMNLILVVFNLIPAFPLDGGRVLRSALWKWKGSLRAATRTTSRIGAGFGVALIVLGVMSIVTGNFVGGMWWVLIGLFLRAAAQMSYRQLLIRRMLEGEEVERFMATDPVTVQPATNIAELVENFIYRHHHRMFPVTENGRRVLGCISARQIRDLPREVWSQKTVGEVALPCSKENTIELHEDATEALTRMQRSGQSRLMVVDGERLCGILTLKDLLRFLSLKMELEEEAPTSRWLDESLAQR